MHEVFNSVHRVTYARQFFRNKPGHKIYRCMSVRSTQHHTFLHDTKILHTKEFSLQPVIRAKYTAVCQHAPQDIISFYIIPWFYIQRHFRASLSPAQENIVHFKIRFKHTFKSKFFPFSLFRVTIRFAAMVTVMVMVTVVVTVTVHSDTCLQ